MTIALAAALEGIQRAELQVNRTAERLARPFAANESRGDVVDLSAEMTALMEARNNSAASVKLAQTADEMQDALLNLVG
jgi:hypothetical protein